MSNYPKVNYIGNKEKIASWICDQFPKDAKTLFDAFSGGCSLSYEAKSRGLEVCTNDVLKVNYHIANALIKNNATRLTQSDIDILFSGEPFEGFMFANYSEVYFFSEECKTLDLYRKNIEKLDSEAKKSLAFALIRRAMIRKMPYSRFNLSWEQIVQLRDEDYSYKKYKRRRAYHNKSFKFHVLNNLEAYNAAIFSNNKTHNAHNDDVFNVLDRIKADIIYLDPPYTGSMNNYFGFYGLMDDFIASEKTKPFEHHFMDKKSAISLFDTLFSKLSNFKYWYLSYNNSSYPSKEELLNLLHKYADNIKVIERKHVYKITGKEKKEKNKEFLFIVENKHHDKNQSKRTGQAICETAN
ncbi:DNA adenine methylase [Subsaximicrobium wynnwilliamsii]|uniref:site-specific DNA-methyltransferase (adenine-specific) n=1 Tax=Subsaximicrobium wynnwilliamsii TaxID=291179 RepID=A0A5C6ZPP1_9FLAO|nr:DNA adenine methylase [Subsaximicrobium wynnwilliamsii]TXD85269.1 DNA adenine methylase [Subsaximicrobium wynnwilliamsii]TXD91311.1 DNA adenine methylase [Subsaximicrobium wynnwilliamsii]TXE04705.1 DNA adenine methylase [Subsaximicrobium wynnwilliamsii]